MPEFNEMTVGGVRVHRGKPYWPYMPLPKKGQNTNNQSLDIQIDPWELSSESN